jgi:hypothetical protein
MLLSRSVINPKTLSIFTIKKSKKNSKELGCIFDNVINLSTIGI